jgi:hypothetical protein
MRIPLFALVWLLAAAAAAQEAPGPRMTQDALQGIIAEAAAESKAQGNVIVFRLGEATLVCVSDEAADRMRIFAPIKPIEEASVEELLAAMHANFHTVLDARYAMSNGMIYAAFLHPLSPLTRAQVLSAIRQVATARESFGTAFSGGGPAYGGPRLRRD